MKRTTEETIKTAKELYKKYKDWEDPPTAIAIKLEVTRSYIIHLWSQIAGVPYEKATSRTGVHNIAEGRTIQPIIEIPIFRPKAKDFIDRTGKKCKDVSEFFGIIENGGECYKDIHYIIPKGKSDSFRGNVSDLFM